MLCLILSFAVLAGIIFVAGDTSAPAKTTRKLGNNKEYLGSEPSKAYYFPWMVTVHLESEVSKEFFGSGSILTGFWVISSMDSFVRRSIGGEQKPFYQQVEYLYAYSGGVWGTPYIQDVDDAPVWFEKRKITEIRMFSDVNTTEAHVETFVKNAEPRLLNTFKRSPFGFSMSVCLVRVSHAFKQNREAWLWKRNTLPIPLFDTRAHPIKVRLESEMELLEQPPHTLQCFVGGWRLEDKRLVQHKVVYVPFSQCQIIYCGYDQRACFKWPVRGVHVCFKSLTFTDLCWLDQGSALYCRAISESVIAILTSGPTCGYAGLPGVYTLIHHAMELYERVWPTEPYVPISGREALKYTPPPEKLLIPVYR